MKGYKGCDKNLKCREKQYEIGKTEIEDSADLCNSGMHFCEYPLDCFAYYPPSDSRYCEVDADEVSDQRDNDSKRSAKKLTRKHRRPVSGYQHRRLVSGYRVRQE